MQRTQCRGQLGCRALFVPGELRVTVQVEVQRFGLRVGRIDLGADIRGGRRA
jgi:hypothetical protein